MSVDVSLPSTPAPSTPPPADERLRPLSFDRTAPRGLVHRRAVGEVLLTDWIRLGPHRFQVGAQWPRGHAFYGPVGELWHDPLLAAESVRQSSSLVGHVFYDLPCDHPTLMTELDIEVSPDALRLGDRPADTVLHIDCAGVTLQGARLTGMTMDVALTRGAARLGRARMTLNCLRPSVYRRLRGVHAQVPERLPEQPAPLPPREVGRAVGSDVVLGPPADGRAEPGRGAWPLRINWSHPTLFDHPTDHVPGMLLLEAARQAAQRLAGPEPVLVDSMQNRFLRYVELDSPVLVRARLTTTGDGGRQVRVTAEQDGSAAYTCVLTVQRARTAGGAG
ncbi:MULTISPECIES: ScbA/BarX family gamma-butyrolactone biosynthesis protein [Streptomyces]|uniref:ScbA/BarX family gamma-butyrolactone biosynthesis protein n=1 Tax=Streptomyces doudnae TaxID=3075536 RepID=A0ABD5EPU0_9ACTN|nr:MULTISPECIES: ScbA/BarX family gamma-butyrolactone biosynthesis protein [unclassified Streptomyces]MDT0436711.1 ScbA/BarX family gamma-butyrolactone biosynthesis protein [Streptomyces sp. DSM 41981]MYQ68473.1 transcriptional regulator [Streptomyces sp. SID4950]SCE46420.1 A-factor biosynthesis hotdog domain-containing protein [Streptomyces sp. SolWspMP-5a-2]